MKTLNTTKLGVTFGMSCMLLTGCGAQMTSLNLVSEDESLQSLSKSAYDVNLYAMNKVVCDPFDGGGTTNPKKGIKSSLYYKSASQNRFYSAMDYILNTTKSSQSLFFSDMNVPTRMFTEGFATQSSAIVADDGGNRLIEFFALDMKTTLALGPNDEEGLYELAALADDGLMVQGIVNGQKVDLIQNDGDHPTRMGCSSVVLDMKRATSIPLQVQYYQGPRYHISNVLMWRKVPGSAAGQDVSCGATGNNLFFNPNDGSKPMKAYLDLQARGWKPLTSDNFLLPGEAVYNPCVEAIPPEISGFRIESATEGVVIFSWTTNVPTTGQLLLTRNDNQVQTVTQSDNLLRTNHRISVTGLQPDVSFSAQAVSVSVDLGRAVSGVVTFLSR